MTLPAPTRAGTAASFDLLGPLPTGTVVLEASAGTGKTFTIAGLVTRMVAEGECALDELLVITFGRAATRELRERVRDRLVTARDGLADPLAAVAAVAAGGPDHDPLLRLLASGPLAAVEARHARLVDAAASYDAATVVTTHGFCEQVLRSLGTAGDVDDDARLVDDLGDLLTEVVDDFYVRKWGQPGAAEPELRLDEAMTLARAVVEDPAARLVPVGAGGPAAVRHAFATRVREEVARRKRVRRVIGYDDLLTRLRDTLADPVAGPAARARLRRRFRAVLVDEFQDTDPVQWDILREAFHGAATLVLVGDPKQAIYAFRGADVHAYLDATEVAGTHATLDRNWRSDPDLLRGLQALFRGAALGDPRIAVSEVAAGYAGRSLTVPAGAEDAPVRLRMLRSGGETAVAPLREAVVADVVCEIVDLLGSGPRFTPRPGGAARPVAPGDVAVVVRTHAQLDAVHAALLAAGVPAVRRTTSSVFRTAAARDWIVLFEALEQPHRGTRLRRLALTPFVGWDAAELAAAAAAAVDRSQPGGTGGRSPRAGALDALAGRLRAWRAVLADRGVAALFEAVSRDHRLAERLLGEVDGERVLTDLRHVGETLHGATMTDQLGVSAALEWLRARVGEAGEDAELERSRRLDSDVAAVQCVTVHASKGLEFPVVLVPFGWDRYVEKVPTVPLFHGEAGDRVRDVGGVGGPSFTASARAHRSEEFGEDLRLLYVALTRAQSRLVLWWAPAKANTPHAPLHRLLFGADPAAGVAQDVALPADAAAFTRAAALAVPGALAVEAVHPRPAPTWRAPLAAADPLAAATLDRALDTAWRRTSYTALTAAVHDVVPAARPGAGSAPGGGALPAVASEPEQVGTDDEPDTAAPTAAGGDALRDVDTPWSTLPGGAAFGTTVHAVLEDLDTGVADLAAGVWEGCAAAVRRLGPAGLDPAALAGALTTTLRTPLGPLAGGQALADIAPADRLAELEFELPLAGGDTPHGSATLAALAACWARHLPADDPLAGYASLLAGDLLGPTPLRGYLTGSIDAVLRVRGRYVVVDYKTNRLGAPEVPLSAWDFRPAALADAMLQAHYPLQALLYEVALHRFLRWRVADYRPERDLGGVLYLFLRGMVGPGVVFPDGEIPGVFAWHPPAALVEAASDLLAGGPAAPLPWDRR